MQTKFSDYDAVGLLEKVEQDLGLQVQTSCQRTELPLPKSIGEGLISTYLFRDGLSLFLFNGRLQRDWEWVFDCEEDSPTFLFFSLGGDIEDVRKGAEEKFVLPPLHTLVVVHPGGVPRSMVFKKDNPISLAVIRLDQKRYFDTKSCCPHDIAAKLRLTPSVPGTEVRSLLPPDRSAPEMARLLKDMLECPYNGFLQTCIVEAKARQFLALILERLVTNKPVSGKRPQLSDSDLEKIHRAREILVSNLIAAPTIIQLSRKVGLNQQKLKQGFKTVYEKTIHQYLVEERMEAAKKLMLQRPVRVSEVAEKVGYAKVGHFAKRFKEHFGILPGDFSQMN